SLSRGASANPVRGRCIRHEAHITSSLTESRLPQTGHWRGEMKSNSRVRNLIRIMGTEILTR
ncbi:MAG: hypothetical protein J6I34_06830, partial [Prevotella sp.]|nr:hypothetical protein [Prevotella sp.]